ncbi:MAG: hypothetical protein LRZ85_06300 [Alphaproteobacteria bacterium]|nr:hypothetical protein [Alphaproteobacteria bacterium]MCD8526422.1 hypothetical protein [Alphaproteobacteria bacterium]MCD8571570.1 hypothetical protein [Alphaproteobacteria bacterium]
MKIQISYEGIRLQEQLRSLQAAFNDGALGRVVQSPGKTIAVEAVPGDEQTIINILRRAGRDAGFIILQDDESFCDLGTKRYRALSLEH